MNYNRLEKLQSRRIDMEITNAKQINEIYRRISQSDSVKYVLGAMQPIDPEYTKATYAEGDRVWNQLDKNLMIYCKLRYQGSVTNDTHIKAKSDIDLLTVINKFVTLERPQEPSAPYQGNPSQDLYDLRKEEIDILTRAFPEAKVDSSGKKAISLEGGSLRRKIDVVPCNWFNTNKYAETDNEVYRAVQILDAETGERIKNTPFLHNALIDHKDKAVGGGLRKAARLMKSLKYDTESIDLSSYDIVAIAYNIEQELLNLPEGMELTLLQSCCDYCERLLQNNYLRDQIYVPDGHRKVFESGHATRQGLEQLTRELVSLRNDVLNENSRSFNKLAEARVVF